jgi:anti-anti-sigma factor
LSWQGGFKVQNAVQLKECGDAVVVAATGEFDVASAHLLRAGLEEACALQPSVVVVDLTEGSLYDSVAIGAVLDARDRLLGHDAVLLVRSSNRVLARVFEHLGLGRVLAA